MGTQSASGTRVPVCLRRGNIGLVAVGVVMQRPHISRLPPFPAGPVDIHSTNSLAPFGSEELSLGPAVRVRGYSKGSQRCKEDCALVVVIPSTVQLCSAAGRLVLSKETSFSRSNSRELDRKQSLPLG